MTDAEKFLQLMINLGKEQKGNQQAEMNKIEDCINCGACVDECPVEAISEGDGKHVINADECIDCGACAAACPTDAISEG